MLEDEQLEVPFELPIIAQEKFVTYEVVFVHGNEVEQLLSTILFYLLLLLLKWFLSMTIELKRFFGIFYLESWFYDTKEP